MIKVSILCLTYNQKKYIKETLDGFLKQRTDFAFEILINDDASTDGTTEIIKEYQKKYPHIIKPNFQKENLYSKGVRHMIVRFLIPKTKGEYLALCEGDDYWTDPYKLQKQVDFMEKNPDYTLCFHRVEVVYEDKKGVNFVFPDVEDEKWYTRQELLKTNYIPTNSVMYRKQTYQNMPLDLMPGDWFMHLYHARFGKIKFMPEVMSVYRKHEGGMWWEYDKDRQKIWVKHGVAHFSMQVELLKIYGEDPIDRRIIIENAARLISEFCGVDENYDSNLVDQIVLKFPDIIPDVMRAQAGLLEKSSREVQKLTKDLLAVGDERHSLRTEIEKARREVDQIKGSRAWKLYSKMHNTDKEQG